MIKLTPAMKRMALTQAMSFAWSLIYGGRRIVRFAERVEWVSKEGQLRLRVAARLMNVGEDIRAHGEALEAALDRWSRALGVPMDDVLRPLVPQLYRPQ